MKLTKLGKILFYIFTFLLSGVAGYYLNDYLEYLNEKPDINVILPQSFENNVFPIILDNTGDKTLRDIEVQISSCYMNKFQTYYVTEPLPKDRQYKIEFKNELTQNKFNELDCINPQNIDYKKYGAEVKVYKNITSNKIIIPKQTISFYGCGSCYWGINITSDLINKSLLKEIQSPVNLVIEGYGEEEIDLNSKDIIYDSSIWIRPLDYYTWNFIKEK